MATRESPAYVLVAHVWENADCSAWVGHKADGLNQVMASAVGLAIRAGLRFVLDDFRRFFERFRGAYWFGASNGGHSGEGFYSAAVECGNGSACEAFETFAERPAWRDANSARVCIGSALEWNGERCTLTSIRADRIGLCSYKSYGEVLHRYGVSVEEWREEMKARRARRKKKSQKAPEEAV